MAKVLLLSVNRCTAPDPVFPLGVAHVSASLRRAGHDTLWHDCLAHSQPLSQVIRGYQPDFVGLSLRNIDDVLIRKQETYFGDLVQLSRTVREESRCPIILGGSGYSLFPDRLLEITGADFGFCGEAETSLVRLLAHWQNPAEYPAIPGLVYRDGPHIRINPARRDPFDHGFSVADRPPDLAQHYLQTSGMLNLQTQRGCAFGCCYCTYPIIEGRRQRRRPPEQGYREMEYLQRMGARHAFIVDSVFNSSPTHIAETCEAIARRNLKLRWSCFLRPQGLTAELVRLMARAGLTHVEFGSDSFSDPVLQAYGKGLTFDDIRQSSELVREANLDYCHFLICGGPGETPATLRETFERSLLLKGSVIMAVVGMRIYPGTKLAELARSEGLLAPGADLLTPNYYLAPGLTTQSIFEQLQEFARRSPNWIIGDPSPTYAQVVERLRKRGTVGPLWSYLSLIQRLWPQPAPAPSAS